MFSPDSSRAHSFPAPTIACRLAPVILLLLLAACATREPAPPAGPLPVAATPVSTGAALADLAMMPPYQAAATALDWAREYLATGRSEAADLMMAQVRPDTLPDDLLLEWAGTSALLHLAGQRADEALAVLDLPRVQDAMRAAPPEETANLSLLRADALTLKGELMESLRARVGVDRYLSPARRDYNRQMIWTQLMLVQPPQLEDARRLADSPALRAWLELAALYRDPLTDIDTQMHKLDEWRSKWPDHPAAASLPGMIQALQRAVKDRPQSVAVLLPLEGSLAAAGEAIRDGLLTAYYSALEQGYPTPQVAFYNSAGADIVALYNQALDAGARLVIGPLDKDQVNVLARVDALPVPTLTLNYAEVEEEPAENLYQFGLAPEDEARQVAEQTLVEGARLAAVLYPEGEWGARVAAAFSERFESLGGIVTTRVGYADDPAGATRALLDIGQSQARARALQAYTGLKIHFEPRRRQDIDIVFMIAGPAQARQLKPALNFNYASDLPVFATSYVYGGTPSPRTDSDLNGIRFVDLPWILERDSRLHREADKVWAGGHDRYERLFALGVDAYRLHARLGMLHAVPDSFLPGVTGQLRVDDRRRLTRELQWAFFTRGSPQRMPVVAGGGERNHGTAVVAPATR